MLSISHPTTFLFLEVLKELCNNIGIEFFKPNEYETLVKNNNIMELS